MTDYPPSPLSRGELRILQDAGHRQLVAVLAVHPTHTVFAMTHTYPEWATADDLVFPAGTVAPYPVVLCTGIVGTAFTHRYQPETLGTLPTEAIGDRQLVDPRTAPRSDRWYVGSQTTGPFDARTDLHRELRRIVADLSAESLELLLAD